MQPTRQPQVQLATCLGLLGALAACSSDAPETASAADSTASTTTSPAPSTNSASSAGADTSSGGSGTGGMTATTSSDSTTGTSGALAASSTGGSTTGSGGMGSGGDITATITSGVGGSTSSGGSTGGGGSTVTFVPGDYVSRKWARWPIPTPPALGLPNPMSYSATAEGVFDEVTGLTWQAETNSSTTHWQDALSYCESLGQGWSLPTRIELTSIVDNTVSGAKWDQSVFGGTAGWTWASTPWVVNERRGLTGDDALSWFINFAVGDSNNSLSQTATSAYARCVKLPASRELPAEHYSVTDVLVTDNYTGLSWQRAHSSDDPTLAFDEAVSYCENLELEGDGWRLPSLNELASLVDDVPSGDVSPAIDHDVFPETAPDALYWSVSPYGTNTGEHWTLNFEDGFTAHDSNDTTGIARCVR